MPRIKIIPWLILALSLNSFNSLHDNHQNLPDNLQACLNLDQMVASIHMPAQFHAAFVYKHQQSAEAVHYIEGDIWVKANKYRLHIEDQIVVSNGKTIWNYIPSLKEVQICDDIAPEAEVNMDHFSPLQLLQLYQHGFVPTACDTTIIDEAQYYIINFIPTKNKKQKTSIIHLQLYIDAHTWQIKSIQLREANRSIHHFDLKKFTMLDTLPDQDFEFTIPPACREIIDLR